MDCDPIPFVVNLEENYAIEPTIVGGKGVNLAILYQRKFSVPDAFIVTTSAYEYVLHDKQVQDVLRIIDDIVDVDNLPGLESVSQRMKKIICDMTLPEQMSDLILKNYDRLCLKCGSLDVHVAVRSSATAEDLPDNSFAGQQDTYLHVTRTNLISKIQECWASLFTARAISYRRKCQIDSKLVKLAVVVQQMIFSEVSGVAFTANPITGLRNEVVIDSSYGLGEALVSGLVTPDHYEILMKENQSPEIRVKKIGEKSIRIHGKVDGGTETLATKENEQKSEALNDQFIVELARLAKQIEKSYNHQAQDLEWAFYHGRFYILQARPITTLFPIPKALPHQTDLRCYVSFGTVQGFLEPMTPLGESALRTAACSFLRKVGINRTSTFEDDISSNPSRHYLFKSVANRSWLDLTGIFTLPMGGRFGLSLADAGMGKVINYINRPAFFPRKSIFASLTTLYSMFMFVIPIICRSIRNFLFPRYAKRLFIDQMAKYHRFVDRGFERENNQTFTDCVNHVINVLSRLARVPVYYGAPCLIPSIISLKILEKFAQDPNDALVLTRAVESNPTTEMNLNLWKLTVLIRDQPLTLNLFENETLEQLVDLYQNRSFEQSIQLELERFFRIYGCRGIGEIDLGRRRWGEQPEAVLDQIRNYLKITNPDKAVSRIHERSQETAYEALHRIESQLKYPWIEKRMVHYLFARFRILFSLRECPKFDGLIQTFGKCRQALIEKAELAVKKNFITHRDQIVFLYFEELQKLAADTDENRSERIPFWKELIVQRQNEYQRQMAWKRIPLLILSNGMTYYDATSIPNDSNTEEELAEGEFRGNPVSPGVYEGKVRIVEDPMHSQLQPGEILVCTATDPAWTSLFPIVGALVLEMGGMLQHGAIVSREYGLPAVVGVNNAKKIFHNGQTIRVNGSNGLIQVLSDV